MPKLQNYGTTAFFISGTLGWNGWNTFQRKLTTTKHGCFFFKNRQEQLMWQKIIISSCNKTFKQVLSFLSNLLYLYFRQHVNFWNSEQVLESVGTVVRRCSVKRAFLEISLNSQENTCARDYFLIKLSKFEVASFFRDHLWWLAIGLQLYLKKIYGAVVFLWILRNLIEKLFSQNTSGGCFWISKKLFTSSFFGFFELNL